jgi:hypothetical protein
MSRVIMRAKGTSRRSIREHADLTRAVIAATEITKAGS